MSPQCQKCKVLGIRDDANSELYCPSCGDILMENIYETTPKYVKEGYEEDTLSTDEKFMNTYIDGKNKDVYGKAISFNQRKAYNYLRIWQRKLYSNTFDERSLHAAEVESERLINALKLSLKIKHKIMQYFRQVRDLKITKGKNTSGIMSAILYIVCLKMHLPLTLDEIVEFSAVKKRRVTKIYKIIIDSMQEKLEIPSAKDFVRKYVDLLDVPQDTLNEIHKQAINLLDTCDLDDGRSPSTLSCTLVYFFAKKYLPKLSISAYSKLVKITTVTLRNKYKELVTRIEQ